MAFWVYKSSNNDSLLDGDGYPVYLGSVNNNVRYYPSAKVTVWADKDAALTFLRRKYKGSEIRDLGDRLEVDLPADGPLPARTHSMVRVDLSDARAPT